EGRTVADALGLLEGQGCQGRSVGGARDASGCAGGETAVGIDRWGRWSDFRSRTGPRILGGEGGQGARGQGELDAQGAETGQHGKPRRAASRCPEEGPTPIRGRQGGRIEGWRRHSRIATVARPCGYF